MNVPRLWIIAAYATERALEELVIGDHCVTVEQLDHTDTLSVRIKWPTSEALRPRTRLRFLASNGTQREYIVNLVNEDPGGAWADVEAISPWTELTDAGAIRTVVNGEMTLTFGGTLLISQWLQNYFVPNLAADGLDWIDTTLGPIYGDKLVTLSWSNWNRMQLIQQLITETGYEFSLLPPAIGAQYQLSCAPQIASNYITVNIATEFNAIDQGVSSEATDIVTVVQPMGDVPAGGIEMATIAEAAWLPRIVATGWVALLDPETGANAIVFDGMLVGAYVEIQNGTALVYRQILDSRASDGAVQLASTTLLDGATTRVRIVQDASATPLLELTNPATSALFRRVVRPFAVSGARGERNWVPNATFRLGAAGWNAGQGGWVEAQDTTETGDISGTASAFTASGASSLPVTGFPPNSVIRKGALMQADGVLIGTQDANAATIRSTGEAHVGLTAPTPAAVADNQPLTMTDGTTGRASIVVVDGAQASGVSALNLKGLTPVARKFKNGDKITFEVGGTYTATPTGGFALSNLTGLAVVTTVAVPMPASGMQNLSLLPHQTNLAVSTPVTVRDNAYHMTFAATVHVAYTVGDAFLSLDVTIPAMTDVDYTFIPYLLSIEAVQYTAVTRTNTAADAEWSDLGVAAMTWATGLPTDCRVSRPLWIDGATDAPLNYLDIVGGSGAGSGSTGCSFAWANRPRVTGGSVFSNGGLGSQRLYCAATTRLNTSGAGSVPLMFNTTADITSAEPVLVYRNTYGWRADGNSGFVLRAVNGATTDAFAVNVRGPVARVAVCSVIASLWVPISTNLLAGPTTPVILDIINADNGVVLGTVTSDVPIPSQDARPAPVLFTATLQVELTGTMLLRARITCAAANASPPLVGFFINGGQVAVTPDMDVPLTGNAWANALWHAGSRYLLAHNIVDPSATFSFLELQTAHCDPETLVLGQRVFLVARGVTQRVVRIDRDHWLPLRSTVTVTRNATPAEQLLARL